MENSEKKTSRMHCPFCRTTQLLWEPAGDKIRVFCESCDFEDFYTRESWERQLAWERYNWRINERAYSVYIHVHASDHDTGCRLQGYYEMMKDEEDFPTFEERIKKEYTQRMREIEGCPHEFKPILQKGW